MDIKESHRNIILLLLHAAIVLGISYAIASFFILSTKSLAFFSVFDESDDVPMSDMFLYINSRKGPVKLDTSITIVSIDGCRDRFEIARMIEKLDSLHPKAIGLDSYLRNLKEPDVDIMLENVIRNCKQLVIACILDDEHSEDKDIYYTCNRDYFVRQDNEHLTEGFINLDSDGFSPVRTFTPQLFWKKENSLDTLYCFAAQIVRLFDETAFQKLLQRSGNLEIIHYQPLRFYEIEKDEIDDNQELITGKIVLIGSLSEDFHRTPVASQINGIKIHAHIISTILEEKYIDRLDNIWTTMLNYLLCYLFTLFCWFATSRLQMGGSFFIKVAQVAILLFAFFAGYFLFNRYNIDITYTRSIIVMGVVVILVDVYYMGVVWGNKYIQKHKKTG